MNDSGFYRAFEERYYAPTSIIKDLRKQYLQFVEPLLEFYPSGKTFDIGCGRGEWLELMLEIGMKPFGLDLDEGMLEECRGKRLPAQQGDAVAYLAKLPNESQIVISAFHVVEHIAFDQLQIVVSEALRVLKPGCLLIMETPNPENIIVATRNFYLDPTHQRPLPPQLLSFLPEYYGFVRTKTVRLQESKEISNNESPSLNDVFAGASPDYAVIAQKAADSRILRKFDQLFAVSYGLEFNELARRYDQKAKERMISFDQRLTNTEAQAAGMTEALSCIAKLQDKLIDAVSQAERNAARARDLEQKNHELGDNCHHWRLQANALESERNALRQSWSWRITAPVRWVGGMAIGGAIPLKSGANHLVRISIATLQRPFAMLMRPILRHPDLSYRLNRRLLRYPALHQQLLRIARQNGVIPDLPIHPAEGAAGSSHTASTDLIHLTPNTRRIYSDLKAAIEKNREVR